MEKTVFFKPYVFQCFSGRYNGILSVRACKPIEKYIVPFKYGDKNVGAVLSKRKI